MIYCSVLTDDLFTVAEAMQKNSKTKVTQELVCAHLSTVKELYGLKSQGKVDVGEEGQIHYCKPDDSHIISCLLGPDVPKTEVWRFLDDVKLSFQQREDMCKLVP